MYTQPLRSSSPDLYHGKYVASLFSGGEQGVWYDPSDLSTMFQDAAGTTPVTGVEQPVGLMLDKSKNGVGRNGTKRVNLANNTLNFPALFSNVTVQPNSALSPDGTQSAVLLKESVAGIGYFITRRLFSVSSGVTYKISVYAKSAGRTRLEILTTARGTDAGAVFNLSNGSVITAVDCIATVEDFDKSSGMYQCCVYFTSTRNTSAIFDFRISNTNSFNTTYVGDGVSGIYVWGIDLRLASDANVLPKYQPIITDWPSTMPGNHATQATTASRPVLSSRVNLLTNTEAFATWSSVGSSTTSNTTATTDPLGGNSADILVASATSGEHYVHQSANGVVGANYTISVYAKAREYTVLRLGSGLVGVNAYFDLAAGTVISPLDGSAVIKSVGNGWYQCSLTKPAVTTSTSWGSIIGPAVSNTTNYQGDGVSGIYVWGADIRVANESPLIPSYQRVNTATDYDTQGFPLYLRFDGVDDSLVTPSINFTSTDKMTVFAGVRKFSDAAVGSIVELSATPTAADTTARFFVSASSGNVASYGLGMTSNSGASGTYQIRALTYTAPITNVVVALFDSSRFSGPSRVIHRINAAAPGTIDVSFEQSGSVPVKFGSFPIFIGRRGGTTIPFNGRLYGLIVRGAQTDDLHLTNVERYLANKLGIVL